MCIYFKLLTSIYADFKVYEQQKMSYKCQFLLV